MFDIGTVWTLPTACLLLYCAGICVPLLKMIASAGYFQRCRAHAQHISIHTCLYTCLYTCVCACLFSSSVMTCLAGGRLEQMSQSPRRRRMGQSPRRRRCDGRMDEVLDGRFNTIVLISYHNRMPDATLDGPPDVTRGGMTVCTFAEKSRCNVRCNS